MAGRESGWDEAGEPIPEREVRILAPEGYGFYSPGGAGGLTWPDVRGIAYRKQDGWTLVRPLPPSGGQPAWYPDGRVIDA